MHRMNNLLLICLALAGLSSCKLFKQPTLEKIHAVDVVSIDPDQTRLNLTLAITNPNCYKIRLNELDVDLLSRDREKIGSATLAKPVEIPKKKSNSLDFRIALNTRAAVKMVNRADQKVFVYIAGRGLGRGLGVNKKFAFEEPYEIDVKQHLEKVVAGFKAEGQDIFKLKRSYVSKLGLTESQIRVDFLILNPYGLKFNFHSFPAKIFIGDKESGTGNLLETLSFDEKVYSREGTMVFRISNWKTVVNAVKGAINGEISYRVDGRAQIDAYGMQIDQPYSYQDLIAINISELIF